MNAHNEQPDPASPVVKQNLTTQPAAAQLGDRLDRAYAERNALAIAFAKAALAAGWRAGRGYDDDQSKDWAPQWRHVVYVDLPDGRQVSWHMAPAEVELLDRLPQYAGEWNGEFTARDPSWCRFDAPPAEQEAVAWQVDDEFYPSESLAIEAIQQWGPSGAIAIPLYAAAPVTAAPADNLHAHLLHMLGAKDHEDAGRIIGQLHAATMRTPGAPGIDIEHFHRAVQRICIKFDGDLPYISGIAEVLDLIDASPKGDDVPHRDLVPGVMRCAKCAFQLHRTNLYIGSGTIGPGDSKTEPCPNGCGPLWPVTWQMWATEGWQQAERYHDELRQLQDSPKGGSEALLSEVCELLGDAGCGACAGSMAPMEDLHGRIVAHLASAKAQASDAEVRP